MEGHNRCEGNQNKIPGKAIGENGSSKAEKKKTKKGRQRHCKKKSTESLDPTGDGGDQGSSWMPIEKHCSGRGEVVRQEEEEGVKKIIVESGKHGDKTIEAIEENMGDEKTLEEQGSRHKIGKDGAEEAGMGGDTEGGGRGVEKSDFDGMTVGGGVEGQSVRVAIAGEKSDLFKKGDQNKKMMKEAIGSTGVGEGLERPILSVELQSSDRGELVRQEDEEGVKVDHHRNTYHGEALVNKDQMGETGIPAAMILHRGEEEGEGRRSLSSVKGVHGATYLGFNKEDGRAVDRTEENIYGSGAEKTMEVFAGGRRLDEGSGGIKIGTGRKLSAVWKIKEAVGSKVASDSVRI